jgi:hypothetical protein
MSRRILAVVATLVVNELVRVAYRGVGPVFASPVFCGVGLSWAATAARSLAVCADRSVPLGKYWRSNPFDAPMFVKSLLVRRRRGLRIP